MKQTTIEQLFLIKTYIYQVPYDKLTNYLKGIRDMINFLNGEEQDEKQLCDTVYDEIFKLYK